MVDDHLNDDRQRLILVTGASGAGLSTALDILEDSGINAVDNLPLAMIDTLVALEVETGRRSLAMGLDRMMTCSGGSMPHGVSTRFMTEPFRSPTPFPLIWTEWKRWRRLPISISIPAVQNRPT